MISFRGWEVLPTQYSQVRNQLRVVQPLQQIDLNGSQFLLDSTSDRIDRLLGTRFLKMLIKAVEAPIKTTTSLKTSPLAKRIQLHLGRWVGERTLLPHKFPKNGVEGGVPPPVGYSIKTVLVNKGSLNGCSKHQEGTGRSPECDPGPDHSRPHEWPWTEQPKPVTQRTRVP